MRNVQRSSPCGRVEPQAYGGRKIGYLEILSIIAYDVIRHINS